MKLTSEEKNVLLAIIDTACKAGGVQIARQCLYFYEKISKDEETQEKVQEKVIDKAVNKI